MIIPLGDAPNYAPSRPWVNYGLIAVNVAVFLYGMFAHATPAAYQAWVSDWGFVPVAPLTPAVTAKLEINYRRPIPLGTTVRGEAWLSDRESHAPLASRSSSSARIRFTSTWISANCSL